MFSRWQQSAVDHGLRIGQGVALPVRTRSVTRAEALGRDRAIAAVFLVLGVMILVGLIGATMTRRIVGEGPPPAWPAYAFSALVCGIGGIVMHNRRAAYADPQIAVEVDQGGITIRSPHGEETIGFADADFDVRAYSVDGGAHFVGIVLNCRAGLLDMHDLLYRDGRKTSAAILARADAAGRRPNGVC